MTCCRAHSCPSVWPVVGLCAMGFLEITFGHVILRIVSLWHTKVFKIIWQYKMSPTHHRIEVVSLCCPVLLLLLSCFARGTRALRAKWHKQHETYTNVIWVQNQFRDSLITNILRNTTAQYKSLTSLDLIDNCILGTSDIQTASLFFLRHVAPRKAATTCFMAFIA